MNIDDDPSNSDNVSPDFQSHGEQPTIPPQNPNISSADHDLATQPPGLKKTADSKPLCDFGDYELLDEIARGGMGVVYRGRQKSLNRNVAIKMILAGQFASRDEVDRFYVEAKSAAQLDHPGIVPVYDYGEFDGHHYFSMKLIEGSDVKEKLKELRNDIPKAVGILKQVCDAVNHAHQRGVLHRDLKPGNILLDHEFQPFVTDLGLARTIDGEHQLTRTGAVLGTPSYMSPEQASGSNDITTAADIYSLGAILYEILTGQPPFQAASAVETLMQVINELPEKPSTLGGVDPGLESICMKCLAKNTNDRYATAELLARDLQRWLDGEPISVGAPSLANATRYWMKQNFGSAIWALLIGPLIGAISALSVWYSTIGMKLQIYETLPSAQIPFSFGLHALPDWAGWTKYPLMLLFVISIVIVGYVTVLFVRPKNRGADLATGLIVGLFSCIAAFMFAFGPLVVLATLDYNDMQIAHRLGDPGNERVHKYVIETYPELGNVPRRQQAKKLLAKMESDHYLLIPTSMWCGAFISLAAYFLPCLFETIVAGPILRKHKCWYVSFPVYWEATFPIVVLMTIITLAIASLVILGSVGFLWTIRLATLIALAALAVVVLRFRANVYLRIGVQACFALVFVWFFATDFPGMTSVSRFKSAMAKALHAIELEPDRFGPHRKMIEHRINFCNSLIELGRENETWPILDTNIRAADQLATKTDLDNFDGKLMSKLQCMCRLQKANLLITSGRLDEAEELWERTQDEFPSSPELFAVEARLNKARKKSWRQKSWRQ